MIKRKFRRFLSFFMTMVILLSIPPNLPKASAAPNLSVVPISGAQFDYINYVSQSLVMRDDYANIVVLVSTVKRCHLRVTIVLEKRSMLFFWKEIESDTPWAYSTANNSLQITRKEHNLSKGSYRMTVHVQVLYMPTLSDEHEQFVSTATL